MTPQDRLDLFAARALQGLLACNGLRMGPEETAEHARHYAQTLLDRLDECNWGDNPDRPLCASCVARIEPPPTKCVDCDVTCGPGTDRPYHYLGKQDGLMVGPVCGECAASVRR